VNSLGLKNSDVFSKRKVENDEEEFIFVVEHSDSFTRNNVKDYDIFERRMDFSDLENSDSFTRNNADDFENRFMEPRKLDFDRFINSEIEKIEKDGSRNFNLFNNEKIENFYTEIEKLCETYNNEIEKTDRLLGKKENVEDVEDCELFKFDGFEAEPDKLDELLKKMETFVFFPPKVFKTKKLKLEYPRQEMLTTEIKKIGKKLKLNKNI
jgi:hypothetical protein